MYRHHIIFVVVHIRFFIAHGKESKLHTTLTIQVHKQLLTSTQHLLVLLMAVISDKRADDNTLSGNSNISKWWVVRTRPQPITDSAISSCNITSSLAIYKTQNIHSDIKM